MGRWQEGRTDFPQSKPAGRRCAAEIHLRAVFYAAGTKNTSKTICFSASSSVI